RGGPRSRGIGLHAPLLRSSVPLFLFLRAPPRSPLLRGWFAWSFPVVPPRSLARAGIAGNRSRKGRVAPIPRSASRGPLGPRLADPFPTFPPNASCGIATPCDLDLRGSNSGVPAPHPAHVPPSTGGARGTGDTCDRSRASGRGECAREESPTHSS